MVFIKGDPKTAEAGRKGGKLRKNPHYPFKVLKATDPKKLKEIQSKGGASRQSRASQP